MKLHGMLATGIVAIALVTAGCKSSAKKSDATLVEGTTPGKPVKPVVDGERLNSVVMLVGNRPLTDIDYEEGLELVKLFKQGKTSTKEVEEFLVEKSIVEQVAEEESIVVSDERLDHEVERRREMARESSEERFRGRIEHDTGVSFRSWRESLRYQLIRQQIVQIKVTIPQPDEREVEAFYKKNASRVGVELLFREIVFPAAASISAEREIEALARRVHGQVAANPAGFGEAARALPENVSSYRAGGGLRMWTPIDEVAREDRILAGILYNMPQGSVSPVFRDASNRYRIVRLEGKRPVSLERIREMIRTQLFYEKADDSFARWLEEKKKNMVVRRLPKA